MLRGPGELGGGREEEKLLGIQGLVGWMCNMGSWREREREREKERERERLSERERKRERERETERERH